MGFFANFFKKGIKMPEKFVPGGNVILQNDMSASITIVLEVVHESLIGFQIILVNNDAVGVITAEASAVNHPDDPNSVPLVFKDGTSSVLIAAGDSSPHYIDVQTSAPYIHLKYTRTSGTTSNLLNVYSHAKSG